VSNLPPHRLGISIYPEHTTIEQDLSYISLAARYGFTRLFTCLLSIKGDKERIISHCEETILHARQLGLQVIVDVSPRIFDRLNISYDDLSFFAALGADGIRLDLGFTGQEEALMTFNPYGLKIEVNMSSSSQYIDHMLTYKPNQENLSGSHNFYPHRYTGLSYAHFMKCSQTFKERGIRTAAFINAPTATFGPWPVMEGLCTLEIHRPLPIQVQAKHLFKTGVIDDVIIANAYAAAEELQALGQLPLTPLTLEVELHPQITPVEKKIVLEEMHVIRGDVSDYMMRSTASRVKYKQAAFTPTYTPPIRRGDILIDNELYGQYKGELQIALKEMENSGKTNVVGRIVSEELFLLDYLEAWDKFHFQVKEPNISS
jgi:uncharacterized protein